MSRPLTNVEWVNRLLDEADAVTDSLAKSLLVSTAVEVNAGRHDDSPRRPITNGSGE